MATQVFDDKASIFFSVDNGDAVPEAGGCTQAWWDTECPNGTEAETEAALLKLMTEHGLPLLDDGPLAYTVADDKIVVMGAAAAGIEAGMVAYVIEIPVPGVDVTTGRYEITAVGVNDITCAGINGTGNANVDIVIGGAFDDLQTAFDRTDAIDHSVRLYVRSVATLAAVIDVDTFGGNVAKNTFLTISGYNTAPGDMDRGGTYYETPFEILLAGTIDADKAVLLDANNGAFELINIDADNIIIENFHLSNNDENEAAVLFSNAPTNIVFRNCRFSAVKFVMNSIADSVLVDSCYIHSDLTWHHFVCRGDDNIILNCVAAGVPAGADFAVVVTVHGIRVIGCIAINGASGVRVSGTGILAINNTFYGQTLYGINMDNAETGIVFNNIFCLNPGAAALRITGTGAFIYNDYNCFIESDGTPLTVGLHSTGETTPTIGPHSITEDPLFVEAAARNFRLMPYSPARRVGHPTVGAT